MTGDHGHPEAEVFPPPDSIVAKAHVRGLAQYKEMYERSITDSDDFWAEQAEALHWNKGWSAPLCQ